MSSYTLYAVYFGPDGRGNELWEARTWDFTTKYPKLYSRASDARQKCRHERRVRVYEGNDLCFVPRRGVVVRFECKPIFLEESE